MRKVLFDCSSFFSYLLNAEFCWSIYIKNRMISLGWLVMSTVLMLAPKDNASPFADVMWICGSQNRRLTCRRIHQCTPVTGEAALRRSMSWAKNVWGWKWRCAPKAATHLPPLVWWLCGYASTGSPRPPITERHWYERWRLVADDVLRNRRCGACPENRAPQWLWSPVCCFRLSR